MIEEILRVTGYEQVPSTLPALRQAPPMQPADRADVARRALAAAGASEAITYGFQSAERAARSACRRPIAARSRSRSATR